jgi:hypothetical protein
MSANILKNVRTFVGGCDMTGVSNKLEFSGRADPKNVTTWGDYDAATDSIWTSVIGGMKSIAVSAEGFFEAGDTSKPDDALFAGLGANTAWSVCPHTAAEGATAYLFKAMQGSYGWGDSVGEANPWKADAQGSWPGVRGTVISSPATARTADGNGTSFELGAVPAGSAMYAAVHVLGVAGTLTPNVTVTLNSDTATGFPSTATQLTFANTAVRSGEILRTSGAAITDTWWRASWDITDNGGVGESFLILVTAGIGPV